MEKKNADLKAVAEDVQEKVAGFFDQAGKDIEQFANQLQKKVDIAKREVDHKALCPVFPEDLERPDYQLPKLIRIVAMDKRHADSPACSGSIGHEAICRDLKVLNVYPDKVSAFHLNFYPDCEIDFYYVDPTDRNHYIALDDYFHFLKLARVSELQRIAHDLGAKHFRVTYKEQKTRAAAQIAHAKGGGKAQGKAGNAELAHEHRHNDARKVEIAAEMECVGHEPVEPKLYFFKKDPQILNLISLRMSEHPVLHQVYTLELSHSCGMKMKDAMKIDAALNAMKVSAGFSVTREAQSEFRRFLEYEIDF